MKKIVFLTILAVFACTGLFAQSITLDEAIRTTATEMGQRLNNKLPSGTFSPDQPLEQTAAEIRQQLTAKNIIAILNFTSSWRELSDHVIAELDNAIFRGGSLTVVDRKQLDLIRQEQNFQISGEVDDKSQQSIGKLLGAQLVLSGSFTEVGNTYRFRIRVISVETGTLQYSNSLEIKKDSVLTALMPKAKPTPKPPKVPKISAPKPPKEPKPYREPVETKPLANMSFRAITNGGNYVGWIASELGLQAGVAVNSFNFLLDTNGGLGLDFAGKLDYGLGFIYNLGGLIEYRMAEITVLGIGGGLGGIFGEHGDHSYPYIRGSASVLFHEGHIKVGIIFDHNFDYGFKMGLGWHLDMTEHW